MTNTTINDLEKLDYRCGLAAGSVAAEEEALDAANLAADPVVVGEQANTLTNDTMQMLGAIGKLPETPEERLQLATQIAERALGLLIEHTSENVAFHERALAIAQEMPNTWHISGPGVEIYVDCKSDGTGWGEDSQATLDALADPGSHSERVWQHEHPEPMTAALQLQMYGYTVERPELGGDVFMVDGKKIDAAALVKFAVTATPKPSALALVGDALANDPGISDATKQLIRVALGDNT